MVQGDANFKECLIKDSDVFNTPIDYKLLGLINESPPLEIF